LLGEFRYYAVKALGNYFFNGSQRRSKSRRMRWAGQLERMGEDRKVCKVLMGNPEGKKPLGRPMSRWEDGIRIDLRETGLGVWSGFSWLRTGAGGGRYGDEPAVSGARKLLR
jgi:hypothetical protein